MLWLMSEFGLKMINSYRSFFSSTSRYLDDQLNIDNSYFDGIVNQFYPSELQLNKANSSDTEAPFLD